MKQSVSEGAQSRFSRFAWAVLVYNVFVVLFGAFVRATGSGAGCGQHWPLCNGVILPQPQRIQTVIEFTHRLTSGLTLILVAALVVWAWRKFPRGSLLRKSSGAALFFTITEALVGAGLVLFQLVEQNASVYRAFSVMVHLVNTFLLIGSLAVTAWWASTGEPQKLKRQGLTGALVVIGTLAILLLGASGAITALGDTLFPSNSVISGFREDFSPTAHYLIRMRVYHPGIAVSVGIYLYLVTGWVRRKMEEPRLERITTALFILYSLQILLGIANVMLRAPVWMQIVHLLVSNLVWITFVILATVIFGSAISRPAAADNLARLGDHEAHDGVNQPEKVG